MPFSLLCRDASIINGRQREFKYNLTILISAHDMAAAPG
jgi:hypothetical protein